jgi:hypothetical protein
MSKTRNAARFAAVSAARLIKQNELLVGLVGDLRQFAPRVVLRIAPMSEEHTCRARAADGRPGVALNLRVLLVRAAARPMLRVCKDVQFSIDHDATDRKGRDLTLRTCSSICQRLHLQTTKFETPILRLHTCSSAPGRVEVLD